MADPRAELKSIFLGYGIPEASAVLLVRFWELVCQENEVQNLTRITEPHDFAEEHIRDSWELVRTGWIHGGAVDLGTGGGFPGIPCAILEPTCSWLLIDAEKNKIDFVARAAKELGLSNVRAVHGRAEEILKHGRYEFVVSRAVGPVERIYGWISKCSTWNNLVLLKGPRWDEEWVSFQAKHKGKHLALKDEVRYEVGKEQKKRKILWLARI